MGRILRGILRGMGLWLFAVILLADVGKTVFAADGAAILIDGQEMSGYAVISGGAHTVTARAQGQFVYLAAYENGRFMSVSTGGTLEYDFPETGAEIVLYCLDGAYKPVREPVRLKQISVSQNLIYTGEASCVPDDDEAFTEYMVRVKVTVRNGQMVSVSDIEGYELSGTAVNTTNAIFLNMAAAQIPDRIIAKQSTENIDAVTHATCASDAIVSAVRAALRGEPEVTDPSGGGETSLSDGTYSGSAHCLTEYMNYFVDVDVTVENGIITSLRDRTLQTPLSTKDRGLYAKAWKKISAAVTEAGYTPENFRAVDAVSGATISSGAINAAVQDAIRSQTPAEESTGDIYAPENISLYARVYPVVTVRDGAISDIRIVPVADTDVETLTQFAEEIKRRNSVTGLTYPEPIQDDAFALANLIDQILYGKGILK